MISEIGYINSEEFFFFKAFQGMGETFWAKNSKIQNGGDGGGGGGGGGEGMGGAKNF